MLKLTPEEYKKRYGENSYQELIGGNQLAQKTGYLKNLTDNVGNDLNTRIGKYNDIVNRNTNPLEKGVQVLGQGLGLAANTAEQTVLQVPGVKQAVGAYASGVNWLSNTPLIKAIGDKIGGQDKVQEVVNLYQSDPNFKDTVDGATNVLRAVGDAQAIKQAATSISSAFQKVSPRVSAGVNQIKNSVSNSIDTIKSKAPAVIEGKDTKALSMLTGNKNSQIQSALDNPIEADLGIKNGDEALRKAVQEGGQSSIDARATFERGYHKAFNELVKENPNKLVQGKKVLYQFADNLKNERIEISPDGKLDFTKSLIKANPGEAGKIQAAYDAVRNWNDWTLQGTNDLKMLVAKLTKFATEQGGSSKSPFLGRFSHYLDSTIKSELPTKSAAQYADMNSKFSNSIEIYNEMVDAFNSGDPFKRLAQLFGDNNDSLRQIVNFYEKETGNKIAPIVAGRSLAQDTTKVFGGVFNPRTWVDFFLDPKTQAKIVTGVGKFKQGIKP